MSSTENQEKLLEDGLGVLTDSLNYYPRKKPLDEHNNLLEEVKENLKK